jgi:DNA-directed RNA polymerase subunit M/transcription elongation factor TFIIS
MEDEPNYLEDHEDVEQIVYEEEEEIEPLDDEEEEEEEEEDSDDKKEKKIKQRQSDLKEKYNLLASKKKYPTTYKELSSKTPFFELSLWQSCKLAEQTVIEFDTRKKEPVKGLYKCNKCKGQEVYIVSLQTRSADESTDAYANCINCRNVWKIV